jgi:hypothetical protein
MAKAVPVPPEEERHKGHDHELEKKSVSELLRDIITESGDLIQEEFELFRQEIAISMRQTGIGIAKIVAGAVILILAAGFLGFSLIFLLQNYLAPWISALIVGLAFLAIGGIAIYSATRNFSQIGPARQTVETLKEDAEWLRHPTRPDVK